MKLIFEVATSNTVIATVVKDNGAKVAVNAGNPMMFAVAERLADLFVRRNNAQPQDAVEQSLVNAMEQ